MFINTKEYARFYLDYDDLLQHLSINNLTRKSPFTKIQMTVISPVNYENQTSRIEYCTIQKTKAISVYQIF